MGFHAFRNIGFSFVDSEATCAKWRRLFVDFDPTQVLRTLSVTAVDNYVYITYFGVQYRLMRETGALEKETADGWTERLFMNEALVIYHILGDSVPSPRHAGVWVPENTLDPVTIRSGNRTEPLLNGFSEQYSGRITDLEEACMRIGGEKRQRGDLCYEFRPFPQTPMQLVFYDADEDFSAQTQVLVDQYITDYMHFEAVGCMAADLFELLDMKL